MVIEFGTISMLCVQCDYLKNYYANAFYKVGGGGLAAKEWVFKWAPALGWAYGAVS